jgi:S1-C subfamily serine protease
MRTLALGLALAVGAIGCATAPPAADRGEVIRRILASTVQLRAEREGGGRRSGSGVVLGQSGDRTLVLTTRHFLEPSVKQQVWVIAPGRGRRVRGDIAALSEDADLALLEVAGPPLPAVTLRDHAGLGDEVWVVGYPWGKRLTLVPGVVSQIASDTDDVLLEGAPVMVSGSVSYGVSGGGVFTSGEGALVGIVEGYRTARVALDRPERTVDIPVPGETTIISAGAIRRFVAGTGREHLLRR